MLGIPCVVKLGSFLSIAGERCATLLLCFLWDAEALHGGSWVMVQFLAVGHSSH